MTAGVDPHKHPVGATRSIVIRRPMPVVAAQFADVAHHERSALHDGVAFRVLDDTGDRCRYEQRSRIAGRASTQVLDLDRSDRFRLVNTVVAGPFTGSALVFTIDPVDATARGDTDTGADADADAARVTARLVLPATWRHRLVAPLLRPLVGRQLAAALEEDRRDLEEGGYPGVPG